MLNSQYNKLPYVSTSGVKVGSLILRQDIEFDFLVNFGIVLSLNTPRSTLEPWVYTTVMWDTGYRTYTLNGTERVVSL